MDPLPNDMFSYDYQRYVLQDSMRGPLNPINIQPNQQEALPKPFDIKRPDKSDKTKKDINKQKDQKGSDDPKDPKEKKEFFKLM